VDVSPGDIALSDARTELAVSHYDTLKALSLDPDIETRRAKLTLIEPAFDMNKGSAALRSYQVCAVPAAVAFGSRGDRVFIACTGEDSLVVVDTISGGVLSRVPTGSAIANKPYAMVRNPQGNRLLVSNQVSRSVLLFSAEDTPELLSETKFESFPLFSDFIDDTTYVVPLQDPDAVSMVNTVAGTVFSKQLPSECGCDSPAMLRYLPDGRLFLLCEGDHYVPGTLVRLDLQTLGCIEHLELGLYPERMELVIP
jgi:DNA-binding beta-propeller fold protein YncE